MPGSHVGCWLVDVVHGVGCRDRSYELIRHHLCGQAHVQAPFHCDPFDARVITRGGVIKSLLEGFQVVLKLSHLGSVLELAGAERA